MVHLNYCCFLNRSGYATAAQDYICALDKTGRYDINIALMHAKIDSVSLTPEMFKYFHDMVLKPVKEKSINVFHCIPDMQRRIRSSGKSVAFATFETFGPPAHWAEILNTNDAVICPSLFNEKVFRHAGVTKPIFHIPHCIDTAIYNTNAVAPKKYPEFTFLFFGTWKQRKGWPQLVEAWFREFDIKDNVRLVLKTDRITQAQRDMDEIKRQVGIKKDFAPISFETRILTEIEVPQLIKQSDCLVSPTLGEGFGIPGLQAMALGVPVIITNYSGCQDYANEETATLIEPSKFIVLGSMDSIPQFRNLRWANVTVESVAKAMRYVLENPQKIKAKAQYAAEEVAKVYDYESTAKKFDNMLETL